MALRSAALEMKALVVSGLILFVNAVPAAAFAHLGVPGSVSVAFDPEAPETIYVATNFGLLVHKEDHWRWVCPASFSGRVGEDARLAPLEGSLFIGVESGGFASRDDGCGWTASASGSSHENIGAVRALDTASDGVLYVAVGAAEASSAILRSTDGGREFTSTLGPFPKTVFESIRVAPSNPSVVYATEWSIPEGSDPRRAFVDVSTNAGLDWDAHEIELLTGEQSVELVGPSPADAQRVLAFTKSTNAIERVLLSTNGGEGWTEVARLTTVLAGAWSEDGSTAWVGGTVEGLYRSLNAGESFEALRPDIDVHCITEHNGALFVCGNGFDATFSVGSSSDGGETFSSLLQFPDIDGLAECSDGGFETTCSAQLPELDRVRHLVGPADAGAGAPDSGAEAPDANTGTGDGGTVTRRDAGPSDPSAGGCSLSGPQREPQSAFMCLIAALALFRVRRGSGSSRYRPHSAR